MTISAGNGHVSAGEQEACFFVAGECEGRRLESLNGVAAFAAIQVWGRRELPGMLVLVAVVTTLKFNLEERVFSFGDMTLGAFDGAVFAFESIGRRGVIFHGKGRRLESIDGVAGRAFARSRSLGKLAVMRIGLVAIDALCERNRLFEIASGVTQRTIHGSVLAEQWIPGF